MKIIQALTLAALLAGPAVAASAETLMAHEQRLHGYSALAGASMAAAAHPSEARTIKLEEPAISPNGIPTLSDFAAHR